MNNLAVGSKYYCNDFKYDGNGELACSPGDTIEIVKLYKNGKNILFKNLNKDITFKLVRFRFTSSYLVEKNSYSLKGNLGSRVPLFELVK